MTATSSTPRRRGYLLAALGATAVALLFATLGDGVEVPEARGLRQFVVDLGHQLIWALLAGAFAIAAIRGTWSPASHALAVTAGIAYAVFLFAVFVWR